MTKQTGLHSSSQFTYLVSGIVCTDCARKFESAVSLLPGVTRAALNPVTGKLTVNGQVALEAIRRGAWDYVTKPIQDMDVLGLAVDKALERARLLRENKAYQENLEALVRERTGLVASVGASHILTRPYSPWQNGKVERMNQTLAREWAYVRPYATNAERSEALPAFLDHYNYDRPHSACGGLPPMSRVNNVLARNT